MIGKFQKYLSARAKQHDTSLWKHFFRIVMTYIKLLGILWLATASIAVWEGILAECFEQMGAGSPALPVIIWRAFLGIGTLDEQDSGCLWPSEASHCNIWVLYDHYRRTQVSASQSKWGAKGHTKLASVRVNGQCLPKQPPCPKTSLSFSSRKADRHRSISKEKKKAKATPEESLSFY